MPTQLQDPVTTGTAAKRLGVSRQTVHRWIREGRLSAYRMGGEFRIEQRALEDLVEHFPARQAR